MGDRPTDEHAKSVCRYGQQELTCRFLLMDGAGWRCGKDSEPLMIVLALREMKAKGDNCYGPPEFKPTGGDDGR